MYLSALWCCRWTTSADISGQGRPPSVQDWLSFLHPKGEQIWEMMTTKSMIVHRPVMMQNSARLLHLCSITLCDFFGISCVLYVSVTSIRTTYVSWIRCSYCSSLRSGMESCSTTCKHWEHLTIMYYAPSGHYLTFGGATTWGNGAGSAFHFNTAHVWPFRIGSMSWTCFAPIQTHPPLSYIHHLPLVLSVWYSLPPVNHHRDDVREYSDVFIIVHTHCAYKSSIDLWR
jgi:hypothetical protein